MTTVRAAAPASAGPHLFRGLPVIETASLRREPGSLRPVFDQDVWDLTGLADAPAVMSTHRRILDFTAIANPRWRQGRPRVPDGTAGLRFDPDVATLPQAFRVPLNPNSLWSSSSTWPCRSTTFTAAGVTSLSQVRQHHCDAYLATVSRSTTDPGRLLARDHGGDGADPAIPVPLHRDPQRPLPARLQPVAGPHATRSPDTSAAARTRCCRSRARCCGRCWRTAYLLETIGPPLAAEAAAARAADQHEAACGGACWSARSTACARPSNSGGGPGSPAPQAHAATVTQRLKGGWAPGDPLLHMAWHPFVVEAAGAMGHRRDLETLRPGLERWVSECGLQQPWCRNASPVPRHGDGEPVPWALPMARHQLDAMAYVVTSAAYFLTSALSGMRASELAELTSGCGRQEQRPGGGIRYYLASRRIKGEAFGGTEDAWVVIEDVHRAIATAEALTDAPPGQRLFAKASNNSNRRYTALRSWVNGEHGQRLGLESIPDGPVNPRALRRTLAMTIAQRPHGLMATKLHLKHVSVATTEGYTARPGGHQASFAAEIAAGEEAEHLRLTVAAYEDYQRGILPSGRGPATSSMPSKPPTRPWTGTRPGWSPSSTTAASSAS